MFMYSGSSSSWLYRNELTLLLNWRKGEGRKEIVLNCNGMAKVTSHVILL